MAIVSTLLGGMFGFIGFLIGYLALGFSLMGAFALYFGIAFVAFAVVLIIATLPAAQGTEPEQRARAA